jgi:hypothetical protein
MRDDPRGRPAREPAGPGVPATFARDRRSAPTAGVKSTSSQSPTPVDGNVSVALCADRSARAPPAVAPGAGRRHQVVDPGAGDRSAEGVQRRVKIAAGTAAHFPHGFAAGELKIGRRRPTTAAAQGGQIRGQIDVHAGQHRGIRREPGRAQRPAPPWGRQHEQLDTEQLVSQPAADLDGAVCAGVLGDSDPERVGKGAGRILVQAADARLQAGLRPGDRTARGAVGSPGGGGRRGARATEPAFVARGRARPSGAGGRRRTRGSTPGRSRPGPAAPVARTYGPARSPAR